MSMLQFTSDEDGDDDDSICKVINNCRYITHYKYKVLPLLISSLGGISFEPGKCVQLYM